MTDRALCIEVAELCGWKDMEDRKGFGIWYGRKPPEYNGYSILPDYSNDLNAMHEAEERILHKDLIGTGTYQRYLANLESVCAPRNPIFATARQRAEAFVATMQELK